MEIDLNHAAVIGEVENNNGNCCNNGCCEKGNCVCLSSSSSSSCSSNSSPSPPASSTYMELWHACAGPLTSLPKKGNVVAYFPQGHLEQSTAASCSSFSSVDTTAATCNIQPQIFCRVVNVQLLANKENDEVYTQLTLLPLPEREIMNLEGKEAAKWDGEGTGSVQRTTPHMFCKTLTASDTSTHGGFSVPRRAAEDCFPPLDYKQQRPSQELVAKDLHGVEWRFRHIYRGAKTTVTINGQPRRHLLTTGWSIFVSQKNLISGDAVLFLRGEDGELRLGIRRAMRPRSGLPDSVLGNQNSHSKLLTSVVNAVSTKSLFHVFYSPRASHAEFVIPYHKYVRSLAHMISEGTRFKMRVEVDDSPERRFSGIVTGVGDLDPYRWPNSKWRCLTVRWDESVISDNQERVSPWEIDPSTSLPHMGIHQASPRLKKLRSSLQATPIHHPITVLGGDGHLDLEESSIRPSKVLQGQEKDISFIPPLYGRSDKTNGSVDPMTVEKANIINLVRGQPPQHMTSSSYNNPGVLGSERFPKVLQGQEICSFRSLMGRSNVNPMMTWINKPVVTVNTTGCNYVNHLFDRPSPSFYPLASEGARNVRLPFNKEVLKPQQQAYPVAAFPLKYNNVSKDQVMMGGPVFQNEILMGQVVKPGYTELQKKMENTSVPLPSSNESFKVVNCGSAAEKPNSGCKLFGIALTQEVPGSSLQNPGKRSCTKVHKQGSLVGRAIDLSKLNGYSDLLNELERLFGMEGLLTDPGKGWRILYTDSENDMMVVGDDPWHEFCEVVAKIHIYTQEEVQKMSLGITIEDNQSCLEEAPLTLDGSKSSSVGQPDSSSPSVIREYEE